ncbi:hypothetical protein BFJ70_g16955 [Fusarium oxysporum]|uniref:BTB domain-containing protein n=4 Tax=Fusarium oxysporum TaxID=5507 RepID=A0A2H3GFT9_FUSOX|nr:hypothetical protein FOXB_16890 [Fusarium oxysporum f. sp. conglutinans Fo5176]KAG6996458.1 hypothetical protein FocnCong_v015670 [Fusarium oxysporum f. sp. conglutinans]KAH7190358.1 hypothetical protein DER44DRAFT_707926 [Fusarium oxysporum]KAH7471381.1 hypothetical protein FOMA001_g13128 [Fusarium oxysporum f. sp. matthiolae]PCD25554.1 hypothetical protein AU210_014656 [Fusarium oxysporum f. sp. radicis-cucumerinum]RKK11261.1 hypothetical protein BFJ65_g13144 [Fusarium oxysporum f. sp. ce
MAFSKIHEIDPNGDTLLILRNPGAPFAVCYTEEEWPNTLSYHQSSDSTHHEASAVRTEALSDNDSGLSDVSSLPQAEPEPRHIRFRLCSQHLRLASTFFRTLMRGDWKETESEPGFKWTVSARDWDHEAFLMLMNIIHHQTRAVPRTVAIETLAKVAVLVDYYGCYQAVEPWAETWISNLGSDLPIYYAREILLRLTVAWVFSDYGAFRLLTKVVIRRSRGPIETLGLPIPQQIVDALEEKRKQTISHLILRLQSISNSLNVNKDDSYSSQCQYIQLGYIDQNLFVNGLKPLPDPPFFGFSLSALDEAMCNFDCFTNCACQPRSDHMRTLRANVLDCIAIAFKDFEYGLDLDQFRVEQRGQSSIR